MSWVERRLPGRARGFLQRARGQDVLLYAAALAFYAMVSIVPLTIVVMWILSVALGDAQTHRLAQEIRRAAPESLGADQALQRVADVGASLGVVALITALWPATAYGSGLERAFDRMGPRSDRRLEGLRGRGLFLLILLPSLILGSLIGSFLGTKATGSSGIARVLGYAAALATGFLSTAAALVLIYRIFPPRPLAWRDVLRATAIAGVGISVLSLAFLLYIGFGANFQEHYATSGLAGLVILAVWLFLANALILASYRVVMET